MAGGTLDEDEVETMPELIDLRLLEFRSEVDEKSDATDKSLHQFWVTEMKSCFTVEAWQYIEATLNCKARVALWNCPSCVRVIQNGTGSIRCDGCLHWTHLRCAGYKHGPRGDWFCPDCKGHQ